NGYHIVKLETVPFSGKIRDICWDGDGERLVVSGDCESCPGVVMLADTGARIGDLVGHSKPVTSVAFRPRRPFRILSASEDSNCNLFRGPPFRFETPHREHARGAYVNVTRYNPAGSLLASAGSDKVVMLRDPKTAVVIGQVTGFKGTVYDMLLRGDKDTMTMVTGGADRTLRLFKLTLTTEGDTSTASGEMTHEHKIGTETGCMVMALANAPSGNVIALTLDGALHTFSPTLEPISVRYGHQSAVSGVCPMGEGVVALSFGGVAVYQADPADASAECIVATGSLPTCKAVAMLPLTPTSVLCVSEEKRVHTLTLSEGTLVSTVMTTLPIVPVHACMGHEGKYFYACSGSHVDKVCMSTGTVTQLVERGRAGCAVCVSASPSYVAVGTSSTMRDAPSVCLYSLEGELKHTLTYHQNGDIACVQFSPDGERLYVGTSQGKGCVWNVGSIHDTTSALFEEVPKPMSSGLDFQRGSINTAVWCDAETVCVGCGDGSVTLYPALHPRQRVALAGVTHPTGVNSICTLPGDRLVSVGNDGCVVCTQRPPQ
ncbi:hypothetical protein KIPB_002453, partial [Kipferlia bialata]